MQYIIQSILKSIKVVYCLSVVTSWSVKSNMREPEDCLGRVFNFRVGCFCHECNRKANTSTPILELKTRPRLAEAGNPLERRRLSTIELLIKAACFVKSKIFKQLIKTSEYMEVNCTDPSPSVSIPWLKFVHGHMTNFLPLVTNVIKIFTAASYAIS